MSGDRGESLPYGICGTAASCDVCREAGKADIIFFSRFGTDREPGYIHTFIVRKEYRRQGIGSKLYDMLEKIINDLNILSVLDYGCGKSKLLDLIKKNKKIKIYRYDPAIKKYSKLTKNKTDLVICTDVLQHVPLYDLDRVLKEIKSKGIYILFYIKCTNHKTKLPNKTYANCTVYDKKWWLEKIRN